MSQLLKEERLRRESERRRPIYEGSLVDFARAAWPSIDPSPYQDSWAIEALCEHLHAVTRGDIKRLLINFPPRCGKTNITSVCWPAWTWAQQAHSTVSGPHVRFLCGSYNHELSLRISNSTRRLLTSEWYQRLWGDRFNFRADQNTKTQFDNDRGGSRAATSVGGSLLGIGGDIVLIDDPHNTEQVESEADRETVKTWWSEISSTRLNNPRESAIVVIMQRLHDEDVSGIITSSDDYENWTHLCLPMRYDSSRHCVTDLGGIAWEDPRKEDGDLLWPGRFGDEQVAALEASLGPYRASGRLQQQPVPGGASIFERGWWKVWEPADGKYPAFDYVVGSLDSAFTEKEENDPSGFTVWGIWRDENDVPKVMLIDAWRKWLRIHGPRIDREPDESAADFERRTRPQWGLCEWVAHTCRIRRVDRLLIEAKASGLDAAHEMQRIYGDERWSVQIEQVIGDKVARAHAVVPAFSQGLVYAPDREWADMVIDEMGAFPKGRYDDLTDSSTQALKHLRAIGLIQQPEERVNEMMRKSQHRSRPRPLYQV